MFQNSMKCKANDISALPEEQGCPSFKDIDSSSSSRFIVFIREEEPGFKIQQRGFTFFSTALRFLVEAANDNYLG